MFAPKTSAPATGGLSVNTGSANSLFGGTNNQSSNQGSTGASGGLFGSTPSTTQPKPAGGLFGGGGLGGNTQSSNTGSNMFSGLGGQQQNNAPAGSSLFGNSTATTTQPQSTGLFGNTSGATAGAGAGTTSGTAGGGLFGGGGLGASSTTQTQPKPAFGGLGGSTMNTNTGGGLFGSSQNTQPQQQQQQASKPTLSLFGNQQGAQGIQPSSQLNAQPNVVPGVKVDLSDLLPTTKFESCADSIRSQIEAIDTYILNQMKMCNEVASILPTIEQQAATIPNDVEFVQGKLDTLQSALGNDAHDIDHLRGLTDRDKAEGEVAWRAIDTMQLPLQYQSAGGAWWSVQDSKAPDRGSSRKNTMALPDEVERDASAAEAHNLPVNLVDYFSHRSDEMTKMLERYSGNIKAIEDHLHGVELNITRQYNELVASKSRDGGAGGGNSAINDLAAVLGDVEAGIMGVASRLSNTSEQVQEFALGPLHPGDNRLGPY